jgi:hypothetical protein
MTFIRCPNCNNYSAKINTVMTDLESCISFLGFFLILPGFLLLRHYAKRDQQMFIQGENVAGCRICGHKFKIHEADELPDEIAKEFFWRYFKDALEKENLNSSNEENGEDPARPDLI